MDNLPDILLQTSVGGRSQSGNGRYYNCHERTQQARDNYDIVTRVIQLTSLRQSCDNLFITYWCLYQASNRENTATRSECIFHWVTS